MIKSHLHFNCGNSSAVEHDLAKVGVASSNLVSRSIFLMLFFTTYIFSKTITLLPHYCVDQNLKLNANFFGSKEMFQVIELPKSKSKYTIPSLHVKDIFEKYNYNVIDSETGTITFERFCDMAGKKDEIAEALLEKFELKYPCLNSDLPEISANNPLPYDFKTYSFIKVDIKKNALRKRKGSFKAIFKTPNSEKTIYFKFTINGYIDIFKAKHKLFNDKILSSNDYEKITTKIDKLPSKAITCDMPNNLMTKNYISANSILTMNKFEKKKSVLRGSKLRAYFRDGMLIIETEATALKDGNIGDVIKVKTDKGKLFRAKLISKYKVIILE